MVQLKVNGESLEADVPETHPLLWVLRETLGLQGTKFGCGIGQCGACTVLVDGQPVRSCVLPVASAAGTQITTIEGLSPNGTHPVQRAWIEEQVPQCGYCQSGQILSAVALLTSNSSPSDADIDRAITNICRCGTYASIRRAIHLAASWPRQTTTEDAGNGGAR